MKPVIVGWHVGLFVGKSSQPDIGRPSGINGLDRDCRECQVHVGVETLQDFKTIFWDRPKAHNRAFPGLE